MSMRFLLVDKDTELVRHQAEPWIRRGFVLEHVTTMIAGIEKLASGEYLFVGINEDNVNFMPLLKTLSGISNTPVFIVTSSFTTEKEIDALYSGADLYARWHSNPENNMLSVLAHISKVIVHKPPTHKVLIFRDLLLSVCERQVFYNNEDKGLTRHEFDLLHLLLANKGCALTYSNIYRQVWTKVSEDCYEGCYLQGSIIKNTIKRLRKKITGNEEGWGLIENIRGYGYRFNIK